MGRGMKTIPEVSEETLKLESYIKKFKPGKELSYMQIQSETHINMDNKGKQYLRSAFRRAKLVYSAIRGYGVKIAEGSDTMPILVNKLGRIDRAVKRADKTQKTLQGQFFNSLSPTEQKEILYIGAVFGAIRVAAENGRLVYKKANAMSNTNTMSIPFPGK